MNNIDPIDPQRDPGLRCVLAYKAGYRAYIQGLSDKANEEKQRSDEWYAWLRGWNTARFGEGINAQ